MTVTLSEGGVTSKGDMLLTTTTPFSQRAEPSPLWSKASPKRRDWGGQGRAPRGRGSKGPEPLASPNVLHWVGWLPGT